MQKDTTKTQAMSMTSRDALTDILRQGAQEMLAMAIEIAEVIEAIKFVDGIKEIAAGITTGSISTDVKSTESPSAKLLLCHHPPAEATH